MEALSSGAALSRGLEDQLEPAQRSDFETDIAQNGYQASWPTTTAT